METENISRVTETTKSRKQQKTEIICPDCGQIFDPTIAKSTICITCLSKKYDISEGITKQAVLNWCRYCKRYQRPPWVYCELESKELLAICLKKIRGLKHVKLMDAAFRWTEEHSKRIRVELTIRKEVGSAVWLEQTFEVEFVVCWVQCDDCKKDFTPHTWQASLQVRQRALHKKTFLFLEQVMLKHNICSKVLKIEEEPDGLNFFFRSKNQSIQLQNFFHTMVPLTCKDSKEQISADVHEGTANFKFTTIIEIPKICKDDLVILPLPLAKELGGVNVLGICYKISLVIHCYDPVTLRCYDISGKQYYNYEEDFVIVPFRGQETKFIVQDIEEDQKKASMINTTFSNIANRFAYVEVMKERDNEVYCSQTHLGHILKHGDSVVGYEVKSINCVEDLHSMKGQKSLPDVILIRKQYDEKHKKKRIWKLKRQDIEENDCGGKRKKYDAKRQMDLEEFEEEIEQDKTLRKHINLYRDEDAIKARDARRVQKLAQKAKEGDATEEQKKNEEIKEVEDEDWETDSEDYAENNKEMVHLEELFQDMGLVEKDDEALDQDIDMMLSDMEKIKIKK